MADPRELLATAPDDQFGLAGCGLFAQVLVLKNSGLAIKISDEPGEAEDVERRIYERLGPHPHILRCFGECNSKPGRGLALEYLPAGTLARNLELNKFPVQRINWPAQSVEAVRFIHSKGVIHCDISVSNFLVQNDGSLALADFCGSILDGSTAIVAPSTRYSRPLPQAERALNLVEKDDIFALGTVLYEISVGHLLYPDKTHGEIYSLFQERKFPDTTGLGGLGPVIQKCWMDKYNSAEEIKFDLDSKPPTTRRPFLQYLGISFSMALVLIAIQRRSAALSTVVVA